MEIPAMPAFSYSRTRRMTLMALPKPLSQSATTGSSVASLISAVTARCSDMERMEASGSARAALISNPPAQTPAAARAALAASSLCSLDQSASLEAQYSAAAGPQQFELAFAAAMAGNTPPTGATWCRGAPDGQEEWDATRAHSARGGVQDQEHPFELGTGHQRRPPENFGQASTRRCRAPQAQGAATSRMIRAGLG